MSGLCDTCTHYSQPSYAVTNETTSNFSHSLGVEPSSGDTYCAPDNYQQRTDRYQPAVAAPTETAAAPTIGADCQNNDSIQLSHGTCDANYNRQLGNGPLLHSSQPQHQHQNNYHDYYRGHYSSARNLNNFAVSSSYQQPIVTPDRQLTQLQTLRSSVSMLDSSNNQLRGHHNDQPPELTRRGSSHSNSIDRNQGHAWTLRAAAASAGAGTKLDLDYAAAACLDRSKAKYLLLVGSNDRNLATNLNKVTAPIRARPKENNRHQQQQRQQQQQQQKKDPAQVGSQRPGVVLSSSNTGLNHVPGQAKINQCNICGRHYARPSTLKTHLRTHTNERPYKCSVCYKTFSQAANLTAHQRVHTGERPFPCPICGRQFSQSSSVITHLRTHSGERPYMCNMCNRTFSDSSTLTKHCRIHSGEKPYQCDYCPLNFSQSGNLSRHLRLHLMGSLKTAASNQHHNHQHHHRDDDVSNSRSPPPQPLQEQKQPFETRSAPTATTAGTKLSQLLANSSPRVPLPSGNGSTSDGAESTLALYMSSSSSSSYSSSSSSS